MEKGNAEAVERFFNKRGCESFRLGVVEGMRLQLWGTRFRVCCRWKWTRVFYLLNATARLNFSVLLFASIFIFE